MLDNELKERLSGAKSLDEVKDLLKEHQGIDAERAWQELEKKRSVFFGGAYFYLQSKRVSCSRKLRVNTQKYRLWKSKEFILWNN